MANRTKLELDRLTQTALAALLEVSPAAVVKWGRRGCPRRDDRRYDLAAVCRWMRGQVLSIERVPQKTVLELIGVSRPTIRAWETEGLPRNGDNTYDLRRVIPWVLQRLRSEVDVARERLRSGVDAHRRRREAAEASLREIELGERQGRLLSRDAVVAGWIARYVTVKAQLLGLVRRLGEYELTVAQRGAIEAEIRATLERFAAGQVALQMSAGLGEIVDAVLAADRMNVLTDEVATKAGEALRAAVEKAKQASR